jgi:hypothetical protein
LKEGVPGFMTKILQRDYAIYKQPFSNLCWSNYNPEVEKVSQTKRIISLNKHLLRTYYVHKSRRTVMQTMNKSYLNSAGHQGLTPIILATQKPDIRRIRGLKPAFSRPYFKKIHHKKGLVE